MPMNGRMEITKMTIRKRSLLSFGTFVLALLALAAFGLALPGAEALAQGGSRISNLPPDTCALDGSTRTCPSTA